MKMEKKERIWLSPPHMGQTEMIYVKEALDQNWVAPAGPNIPIFEDSIKNFTQTQHAVATNSGTSSLHLGLIALGIEQGDEVICSTFSFVASANPILYLKAIPVLIDSEMKTWNMDPYLLEEAIVERIKKGRKPKAIILVHTYGNASEMDEIMRIATHYQVPVLEDAAEAFGSTYKRRMLGTFGKVGVYSFNGNKIITTSSGGAVVTNETSIADRIKYLSNQAKDRGTFYEHSDLGYNYRMSNILAGIGIGQMKLVYERVKQRRYIFDYYYQNLHDLPIRFVPETLNSQSNRWLTCITLDDEVSFSPEKLRLALDKENIESRPLWTPIHTQKMFKDGLYFGKGISEKLCQRGLALPSGSALKSSELDRVIDTIRKCF
jgi:dTDP-4-amino-4,6-dideoxygalactose transaminase